MITKYISRSNLASRRGIILPELQFCINYESKNTPPQIPHNRSYLCFENIQKYNWDNPPDRAIIRRPDIEFYYKDHISLLNRKDMKIKDHIINNHFNNNNEFVLIINEFPYWVNDATHWICWFNPNHESYHTLNIREKTEQIIKNNFPNKKVVMYENIDSNKTVKDLKHSHIFIKN
jgi:hypothetical protein